MSKMTMTADGRGAVMDGNGGCDAPSPARAANDPVPARVPGQALGGRFQVRRPFAARARNGARFATFELWDGGATLRAYAWEADCRGFFLPRHRERVYAAGQLRRRNGRLELVCAELQVEDPTPQIRWARERLRALVPALEPTVLQAFLRRVFGDAAIGPAFLVAPASLAHHHAFSGGLLVHSADCAMRVHRWLEGEPHRGVATVAALLHDVDKVRTLAGDMTRTVLGTLVRHEALTLEVLAPHLAWLDGEWVEGARLLRHLLTTQPQREEPSPARLALELMRTADRLSAAQAPAGTGAGAAHGLAL